MHPFITTLSLLAVVIGVTGILPQLVTMLRTRSSGGQSILGWALGASANIALGVVNLLGSHAALLALGNLLSLSGCLVAVVLVHRYRGREAAMARPAPDAEEAAVAVAEMRTGELAVLSEAVIAEHRRRLARREAIAA